MHWEQVKTIIMGFNGVAILMAFLADWLGYEFFWWVKFAAVLCVIVSYVAGGFMLWAL